jgi:hypothetical protein
VIPCLVQGAKSTPLPWSDALAAERFEGGTGSGQAWIVVENMSAPMVSSREVLNLTVLEQW